ncbi:hypothetical protein K505DRAFT_338491 [Melanomma pulvis-pyrius CBS 109.77]|uniref:Uncharacterized protein n=1 Tax=Melanomma pulvis-pyrius CBS 109.77 TaxID=1314802 RepID=A0A6A6X8K8_9PLEO|nr:hypothetical protein K505DRAFT_338491 [Melanomma pulvis-pyrius CBS 109.77]
MKQVQQHAVNCNKRVRDQADQAVEMAKQSADYIVKQAEDLLGAARKREETAIKDKDEAYQTIRSLREYADDLKKTIGEKNSDVSEINDIMVSQDAWITKARETIAKLRAAADSTKELDTKRNTYLYGKVGSQ